MAALPPVKRSVMFPSCARVWAKIASSPCSHSSVNAGTRSVHEPLHLFAIATATDGPHREGADAAPARHGVARVRELVVVVTVRDHHLVSTEREVSSPRARLERRGRLDIDDLAVDTAELEPISERVDIEVDRRKPVRDVGAIDHELALDHRLVRQRLECRCDPPHAQEAHGIAANGVVVPARQQRVRSRRHRRL